MATSLPYDIVGHIIDILAAEGDLTPVKNASLTSSSVLHFCRRHIFHTIPFNSNTKSLKTPFIKLLSNSPAIVQYIRELNYEVLYSDSKLSPLLSKLLHTISHLKCLRIRSLIFDWTVMDPLLLSALLHLMYLPTLTHFSITNMHNIPISAFAPCTNLEELDIRYTILEPFEDQCPSLQTSRSKTPRILRFKNVGSQIAIERLLRAKWKDGSPVLDFSHAKTLELEFRIFQDVQFTRELFENTSYLEELEINAQGDTDSLAGLSEMISVNARNLRTLRVITLFEGSYNHTPMCGLCEELKALAGNKVLQVLKFTFIVQGSEPDALVEKAFRRLEEVLMDPGWSALVCVSIEMVDTCSYQWYVGLEQLSSVPEMYLGRLSSRKILSYKWQDFVFNSVELD